MSLQGTGVQVESPAGRGGGLPGPPGTIHLWRLRFARALQQLALAMRDGGARGRIVRCEGTAAVV